MPPIAKAIANDTYYDENESQVHPLYTYHHGGDGYREYGFNGVIRSGRIMAEKKLAAFACFSGGGAQKAIDRLKSAIGVEKFDAELILVDPKDKPSAENDEKISAFCAALS